MSPEPEFQNAADAADIDAALRRDAAACRRLVARVTPAIQRRVAGLLRRRMGPAATQNDAELMDLTQEALLALFENDGRVLRSWDPVRGAALPTFAGLVAERVAISIFRSGRRGGWREDPTLTEDLDKMGPATAGPGAVVEDRQFLEALVERLRETLNPRGRSLFQAIYVDEKPLDEVAVTHGMTVEAVYIWRSRARKLLQTLRDELLSAKSAPSEDSMKASPA